MLQFNQVKVYCENTRYWRIPAIFSREFVQSAWNYRLKKYVSGLLGSQVHLDAGIFIFTQNCITDYNISCLRHSLLSIKMSEVFALIPDSTLQVCSEILIQSLGNFNPCEWWSLQRGDSVFNLFLEFPCVESLFYYIQYCSGTLAHVRIRSLLGIR